MCPTIYQPSIRMRNGVLSRNVHVACLGRLVVRYMCPTICKHVHTHAQWRFVLVFTVDVS